jgi:RNA-binding protein
MTELIMSARERQQLKGEAHKLNPVVLMGSEGLTDALVKEVDRALTAHGLIKIRAPMEEREEREQAFAALADRLSAGRVQSIGKVLVLYRPLPDEPVGASVPRPQNAPHVSKKVASAGAAQRGKPGRSEIRAGKPSAPRRTGGRAR